MTKLLIFVCVKPLPPASSINRRKKILRKSYKRKAKIIRHFSAIQQYIYRIMVNEAPLKQRLVC